MFKKYRIGYIFFTKFKNCSIYVFASDMLSGRILTLISLINIFKQNSKMFVQTFKMLRLKSTAHNRCETKKLKKLITLFQKYNSVTGKIIKIIISEVLSTAFTFNWS